MKNRRKNILESIREQEGSYQYTGDSYRLCKGPDQKGHPLWRLTVCCILTALPVICSGCIDADAANGTFYVILPFVGEVSCLFLLIWNYIRLVYSKDKMRAYVLDHIRSRIPGAAAVLSLCSMAGLALSLSYLIRNGSGGRLRESILYMICKAAAAVFALGCRRAFRKLTWEKA